MFGFAGIPICVRGNQDLGDGKGADDPAEEEEAVLDAEQIALLNLSESDQQKVIAIKSSMSHARPQPDLVLCYVAENVLDIAQTVDTHVDHNSLATAFDVPALTAMAHRMGVYCAFKPPEIVARFLEGVIWRAANRAASGAVNLTQKELISHVKECGLAENPPLTIQMSQTVLSQLWTLCEFVENNDLQRWVQCIDKSWTVVKRWTSESLDRALGWLEATAPAQYYRLKGAQAPAPDGVQDDESQAMNVSDGQSDEEQEQKQVPESRKRKRGGVNTSSDFSQSSAKSSDDSHSDDDSQPSQSSQSWSGSDNSSSQDSTVPSQDAANNLFQASASLSQSLAGD